MARFSARGLLVTAVVSLAACHAPAQTPPAPAAATTAPAVSAPAVRASPTRPAHLWAFTPLQGADYVSVNHLAEHYGLKPAWAKPDIMRTLADPSGVRFKFETNQRDCYLDGVRVFLSAPVLLHQGDLWVAKRAPTAA